jgi:plasmid maintenance system antidote protein VapI
MPRASAKKLTPVHPGEILREEFMAPLLLSAYKLSWRRRRRRRAPGSSG